MGDTASKLAAIEAKEKEEKDRKKKDQDEKNAAAAKEKAKEAPLASQWQRGAPVATPLGDTKEETEVKEPTTEKSSEENAKEDSEGDQKDGDKRDRRGRAVREPEVVNSRAAMLGETLQKEELGDSRDGNRRGPASKSNYSNHGLPPVGTEPTTNSRWGGPREGRRNSPPPVTNSRWGSERDTSRDNKDTDGGSRTSDIGPPPVANSRWGGEHSSGRDRGDIMNRRGLDRRRDIEVGPPPVQSNSRFAAAAADFEAERSNRERQRDERGPPPVHANSRFGAFAADTQRENEMQNRDRGEHGRFDRRREDGNSDGGNRFEGHDRGDNRRNGGGGYSNDRGGGRFNNDQSGGRHGGQLEPPTGPRRDHDPANEDSYFPTQADKSKLNGVLAPKPREEVVLPPVEAPLTLPGEDDAAAKARLEKKRREEAEKAAAEQKAAEEMAAALVAAEKEVADKAAKAATLESKLLKEFVSGSKLGEELQAWCSEHASVLPTVEKLIFHLLSTNESKKPDPECSWSESDNYGTALLSLVEDDAEAQMQVLWAIQKYCDTLGFPKSDDEYLVQVMFRNMYKHDLAEPGAFDLWKDDESEENSKGKMKAVIQTMDWFNWLEEDDEEEDDEEDDEEE